MNSREVFGGLSSSCIHDVQEVFDDWVQLALLPMCSLRTIRSRRHAAAMHDVSRTIMNHILEPEVAMSKAKIAGWILSILLAGLLIGASASGKFVDWEGKEAMFAKSGFTIELMFYIGIVEVVITLLFLIPPTAFIGAILLTGYLGGATVTHLRVGDPFIMPVIVGIVVWIALGLRDSRVFALAFGLGNKSFPKS
jgi:uncharacterized membrane protein YphA (DoxX/SURF4 family)